jgi:hypothetical protein
MGRGADSARDHTLRRGRADGIEVLALGAPGMGKSAMEDVEPAPNWWTD